MLKVNLTFLFRVGCKMNCTEMTVKNLNKYRNEKKSNAACYTLLKWRLVNFKKRPVFVGCVLVFNDLLSVFWREKY